MSYNSSIPIGTNAMVTSQAQIYANFNAINTVWNQNHYKLTAIDNQGMHNSLVFREQTGNPTTSATQVGLYTKAVSATPNLFFAPNSSQTPIQLTYPSIQTGLQSTNPDVYYPQQYSFVAGPFVVYCGYLTGVSQNFLVTLTPTTTLLYAQITGIPAVNAVSVISGSGFTVKYTLPAGPINAYYFAIGKP